VEASPPVSLDISQEDRSEVTATTRQPAFPTVRVTVLLTVAAGLLLAAAWIIVGKLSGGDAYRGPVLFAVLSVWLAMVVGVLPVHVFGPRGVDPTIVGYFSGMLGRLIVCVLAGWLAVVWLGMPLTAVSLAMAGVYLPLLMIEAALVGRYLWQKDGLPGVAMGGAQ
jgi:hypothetical protein